MERGRERKKEKEKEKIIGRERLRGSSKRNIERERERASRVSDRNGEKRATKTLNEKSRDCYDRR